MGDMSDLEIQLIKLAKDCLDHEADDCVIIIKVKNLKITARIEFDIKEVNDD